MKSIVIYDSWFGNTQTIAETIARGIGKNTQVVKLAGNERPIIDDYELVVVGSPTHGGTATPLVESFLGDLGSDELEGVAVAAFDTRITSRWVKMFGFAAKHIARRLQHNGGTLVAPPEGFYVHGKEGPLLNQEETRAYKWAVNVAKQVESGVFA